MGKKETTLHKDGSSAVLNIAFEEGGEKKSYYNTGYSYLVTRRTGLNFVERKEHVAVLVV